MDVLEEATMLLGADAADLSLPDADANDLGLPAGTTFGQAWHAVRAAGNRAKAGRFVRAVLGLRHDPRVQGYEIGPGA